MRGLSPVPPDALEGLVMIQLQKEIEGVWVKERNIKFGTYANDIVYYLSNPLPSIKALTILLHQFGALSGYKINQDKCILSGFNISEVTREEIDKSLPGKWQNNSIRYIGVKVGRTNKDMIKDNVIPLVRYLQERCVQ